MDAQVEFWVFVFLALLVSNLGLLLYIKSNFDKKVGELSQEVKDLKENLSRVKQDFDKKFVELKSEFDKKMAELLQELNSIKANDIGEIGKKFEKMNSEIKQLEQQTWDRIDHIAKLLTEPIYDESQLKT
jgi:septal ring factor EnvC (AmiA/AmiB activator)